MPTTDTPPKVRQIIVIEAHAPIPDAMLQQIVCDALGDAGFTESWVSTYDVVPRSVVRELEKANAAEDPSPDTRAMF